MNLPSVRGSRARTREHSLVASASQTASAPRRRHESYDGLLVDERHVELELTGVTWDELADLELYHDVAQLIDVEEEEIDDEVLAVDLELHLAPEVGEPVSELIEQVAEPVDKGILELLLRERVVGPDEVENVRILGQAGLQASARATRWPYGLGGGSPWVGHARPIGTYGHIDYTTISAKQVRARTRVRDDDGEVRRV